MDVRFLPTGGALVRNALSKEYYFWNAPRLTIFEALKQKAYLKKQGITCLIKNFGDNERVSSEQVLEYSVRNFDRLSEKSPGTSGMCLSFSMLATALRALEESRS